MITFIIGLCVLVVGYIFYSNYVEKQFSPDDRQTPAITSNDGVDFMPLSSGRNLLIQLLNIAGLGPILGALQGILFGPVAFLLIPAGCIFMGGVHDYFCGMISSRNNGAQLSELIRKYLGNKAFSFFIIVILAALLLLATVFVFTAGDIMAERFFDQSDFSLSNPVIITIYCIIAVYYILATLFPIDKIIGRFYPFFAATLILGSLLILIGFFIKGINLQEFNFSHISLHPDGYHILPMFFVTVSCGLLSGFHATQSTIISRTIKSEYEGKKVFYGMMCVESLIAMIWAAAAMHVYSLNLVPEELIGTANVINTIADTFVVPVLAFVVTIAVVILPITSGDTALRALRMTIAETFNIKQNKVLNRLIIIMPIAFIMLGILYWAKFDNNSFTLIWRYFNFTNQLIAIPTFIYSTIFLYKNGKNYFITLIPGIFYIFITVSFICFNKIGFHLPYSESLWYGYSAAILSFILILRKLKKNSTNLK